jgi:hypothetical protein
MPPAASHMNIIGTQTPPSTEFRTHSLCRLCPPEPTGGASEWLSVTDQLYSITREEGFDQAQIKTWGQNMPFEYYYGRVIDLFRHLNALHI